MNTNQIGQGFTTVSILNDTYLDGWMEAFLFDRQAQNFSNGTLQYYRVKLKNFKSYCDNQIITKIDQITPDTLRRYLAWLDETGHNEGGRLACYRAIKTFLRWYADEAEPENWKNPIKKVQPPRVSIEPLDPIELSDIQKMIAACEKNSFTASRDKALILCLADCGARVTEFLQLNIQDINLITGEILIRSGKGRKPRFTYMGKTSRKALRAYLRMRNDTNNALWVTDENNRMSYSGLRRMFERRASAACVKIPSPHDFRRFFAISLWRNGTDIITIARLMGHTSTVVLQRYLKQLPGDLQMAHRKGSPIDKL